MPLLTAGSSDDLLYYIMPFIEGESLRGKLAREGELPVPEALRILRDVLDALAYAHRQGVVHRDIKPDNVLLSQGHALVTDFGVAKAVAESTGRQTLTSMGVALGTPAYMAPEQATADPHTDHRADIYAVGAMAYEMLSGRLPFNAMTVQAMLAAHVTEAPEPVTKHRTTVPEALNQLILRCLEKKPADRWQRADEMIPHVAAMLTPTGGITPTGTQPSISSGTAAAIERTHPVRVAGLFGLAAVGVLAIVYGAVRSIGLPDWVFWGAIALLAGGLPIVLLTGRQERRRALARSSGRLTATPPSGVARHLTWRNAFVSGGLAFGGLGLLSGTYMVLRLLGVGPFATLVSAGVLQERDLLVLADFTNRTPDSTLAASITEALRIDLTRSPVVRLLEGNQVAATLSRMHRDPAAGLPEAAAREVAQREGAKAVVVGEVSQLGSGYVLAARLVSAGDSSTLLAERETPADAAGLIPAVERLSKKLREHIGESLRTIRSGEPLEQVTTTSLAALRAYSEGNRLFSEGRQVESLELFNQAVALDSSFGMAWRRVGVILFNTGINRARMLDAGRRAYGLRDHMPALEAAHTTAFYDLNVLGDRQKAIDAYERLVATWPDDFIALNNLGLAYLQAGRPADATREFRRAVEVRPDNAIANGNVLETLVAEGNMGVADSSLARWAKLTPGSAFRLRFASRLAAEQGRSDLAMLYADSALMPEGLDAQIAGRVRDAGRDIEQAMDLMERNGRMVPYARQGFDLAFGEAFLLGRKDDALRRVDAMLRRHPLDSLPPASRPYGLLIYFYASVERLDRAQALVAEYQRVVPANEREHDGEGYVGLTGLALARKDGRAALAAIRRVQELFPGCRFCTKFEEARAFEQLGATDSALATYEALATGKAIDSQGRDFFLGPALRRLGELYEAKGDREAALTYYGRFVDLWKNADPELQPLVRDVKQRMASLVAEQAR